MKALLPLVLVSVAPLAAGNDGFFALRDHSTNGEWAVQAPATVDLSPDMPADLRPQILLRRTIAERAGRDGESGYSFFIVREGTRSSRGRELWKSIVPGQFRVLGFDSSSLSFLVARIEQRGPDFPIVGLALLSADGTPREVGGGGSFQYARASPTGQRCALISEGQTLTVIGVPSGRTATVTANQRLISHPFDPDSAGFHLGEEILEISWSTDRSGVIGVRPVWVVEDGGHARLDPATTRRVEIPFEIKSAAIELGAPIVEAPAVEVIEAPTSDPPAPPRTPIRAPRYRESPDSQSP